MNMNLSDFWGFGDDGALFYLDMFGWFLVVLFPAAFLTVAGYCGGFKLVKRLVSRLLKAM